ncbi:MAG: hypothetical protein KDA90_03580 [Planctomycetaceae bacterium]|nr:hypothetical protein [Planctomycetaceae bacterium]
MKNFSSCCLFAVAGLIVLSMVSDANAGRCHQRRRCCCQTYSCQSQQTSEGMQEATASSDTTQRFSYEPSVDANAAPVMSGTVVSAPSSDFSRARNIEQRRQHPGQGFRP